MCTAQPGQALLVPFVGLGTVIEPCLLVWRQVAVDFQPERNPIVGQTRLRDDDQLLLICLSHVRYHLSVDIPSLSEETFYVLTA